jgi:hypothetical protein
MSLCSMPVARKHMTKSQKVSHGQHRTKLVIWWLRNVYLSSNVLNSYCSTTFHPYIDSISTAPLFALISIHVTIRGISSCHSHSVCNVYNSRSPRVYNSLPPSVCNVYPRLQGPFAVRSPNAYKPLVKRSLKPINHTLYRPRSLNQTPSTARPNGPSFFIKQLQLFKQTPTVPNHATQPPKNHAQRKSTHQSPKPTCLHLRHPRPTLPRDRRSIPLPGPLHLRLPRRQPH